MTASGTYGLGDPNISMIDRNLANAFYGEGHPPKPCYSGYVYKILKGQGSTRQRRAPQLVFPKMLQESNI